ncbi:hypothetical protein HZS_2649 [Henneguya salminicola]|nr:hypothetical protein HZS_2649 [Henneguya salminicola]
MDGCFALSLWNISAGMMNRANKALKRYNRRLNDFFADVHPNICYFIEIIKEEFHYIEENVVFRPIQDIEKLYWIDLTYIY